MKKTSLRRLAFLLFTFHFSFLTSLLAQNVGINTTGALADASSILDLNTGNNFAAPNGKGLIIPNVMLTGSTDAASIVSPANGLLVFVPAGSGLTPSGYYYNAGSPGTPAWQQLAGGSATTNILDSAWLLTGNLHTSPATNWIGTNDGEILQFKVNGQKAGWIDYSSNPGTTSFGCEALNSITTGLWNFAAGYQALNTTTTGSGNVALGYQALYGGTANQWNIAIGCQAMYTGFSSGLGGRSVAIGYQALYHSTALYALAIGYQALYSNTSGTHNIAIGDSALWHNTNASSNTGIGTQALANTTTGGNNTATGYAALANNTTGANNTATGDNALSANTIGSSNTAIGYMAGLNNTGSFNVFIGDSAGYGNTTGYNNVFLGWQSGPAGPITSATDNTIYLGNTSTESIMANANMNIVTWSDRRVKDSIKENVPGLDFITRLRPVTFHYNVHRENKLLGIKDGGNYPGKYDIEKITQSGFIAQEVDSAAQACGYTFSGIVKPKTPGGLYALGYTTFVVPLVKSVKELNAKNDSLQAEIDKDEVEVAALKKIIYSRMEAQTNVKTASLGTK